ncbi:mycofactocin precursor MftA [[Actinomadura] parvosata]
MNDSIIAAGLPEETAQESEVLTEDMLLEDVSIDGMCGVY